MVNWYEDNLQIEISITDYVCKLTRMLSSLRMVLAVESKQPKNKTKKDY